MANTEIVYVRGKLFWTKILGEPVDNYNKDGKEWVFDLSLDKDGVNQLKSVKVQGKPAFNIKDKDDERGQFITLKQKYKVIDANTGRMSTAPRIVDGNGEEWDQSTKIGNETLADVKIKVMDFGKGMFLGIYPQAVRILDHVPYESQEFAPLSDEDRERFGTREARDKAQDAHFRETFLGHTADDDLDDDLP